MTDIDVERRRLESLPEPVPTTVIAAKTLIEIIERVVLHLENRRVPAELMGEYRVAQRAFDRNLGQVVSAFCNWDVARAFQGNGSRQSIVYGTEVQNSVTSPEQKLKESEQA